MYIYIYAKSINSPHWKLPSCTLSSCKVQIMMKEPSEGPESHAETVPKESLYDAGKGVASAWGI